MILYVFSVMLILLNLYARSASRALCPPDGTICAIRHILVYNYSTLYQKTIGSFLIKTEVYTISMLNRLYVTVKSYLL